MNVLAFSGGKDSTATALRLKELGEEFVCLFTPTGNELPELFEHVNRVIAMVGAELIQPENLSLMYWIEKHGALPNWRQRWCTRQIKIEPCIAWLMQHPGSTLMVGLRADEEHREGLYGSYATYRYPLREWGWGIKQVREYLKAKGVEVPKRTDCALCYGQRLSEWFYLWRDHKDEYARGELLEKKHGHTFRSPSRDSWPASLTDLRLLFETGRVPKGCEETKQPDLYEVCRVCK